MLRSGLFDKKINIIHTHTLILRLAQNSLNKRNQTSAITRDTSPPAYFILILITRGVFDDLKETVVKKGKFRNSKIYTLEIKVQAIIFASRLPVSIIFVGLEDSDKGELERMATARTRLNFNGRKPERDCAQYVSLKECRTAAGGSLETLKTLIMEHGLANIPAQICTWMNRNGHRPSFSTTSTSVQKFIGGGGNLLDSPSAEVVLVTPFWLLSEKIMNNGVFF
jgi:hypothetical protein